MDRIGPRELFLLSALTLPAVVEAQGPQGAHLPISTIAKGVRESSIIVVNAYVIAQQCSPQWERDAAKHGYQTYRDPVGTCYAWETQFSYSPVAQGDSGFILQPIEGADKSNCIEIATFMGEFDREGVHYVVVDEHDILNAQVVCPTETVFVPPVAQYGKENLPLAGNFNLISPEVVQGAEYFAPVAFNLSENKIPKEYRNEKYLITPGLGGKMDVYKRYTVAQYTPEEGRLILKSVDPKDEACLVLITYDKGVVTEEGKVQFFLSPSYIFDIECPEVPSAPVDSVVASTVSSPASKKDGMGLTATLAAGADDEELSPYSLGIAPMVLGAVTVQGLPFVPEWLSVGASAEAIFSKEGSGFEGVNGMVGYKGDWLSIYLTGGVSLEPRRPETALDGAGSVGLLAMVDPYQKGPWAITCGVSFENHLYGGGVTPFNVAVLCGGNWNVVVGRSRPVTADTTPVQGPAPEKSDEFSLRVVQDKPMQEEAVRPEWKKGEAPSDSQFYDHRTALKRNLGGYHRFGVEIEAGSYGPAYRAFKIMEESGYVLSADDLYYGAEAARGLGDIAETKRILEIMILVYPERTDAKEWLENDLYVNYVRLEFSVKEVKPELLLTMDIAPMDPAQRAAIAYANTQLQVEGNHYLFLPKGEYTLDGQKFTVVEGQKVVIKVK